MKASELADKYPREHVLVDVLKRNARGTPIEVKVIHHNRFLVLVSRVDTSELIDPEILFEGYKRRAETGVGASMLRSTIYGEKMAPELKHGVLRKLWEKVEPELPIRGEEIAGDAGFASWVDWKAPRNTSSYNFAAYLNKKNECVFGLPGGRRVKPELTKVRAIADGKVETVRIARFRGETRTAGLRHTAYREPHYYAEMLIKHTKDFGLHSYYGHVVPVEGIRKGVEVKKGDVIATLYKDPGDNKGNLVTLKFYMFGGSLGSAMKRVELEYFFPELFEYASDPKGSKEFEVVGKTKGPFFNFHVYPGKDEKKILKHISGEAIKDDDGKITKISLEILFKNSKTNYKGLTEELKGAELRGGRWLDSITHRRAQIAHRRAQNESVDAAAEEPDPIREEAETALTWAITCRKEKGKLIKRDWDKINPLITKSGAAHDKKKKWTKEGGFGRKRLVLSFEIGATESQKRKLIAGIRRLGIIATATINNSKK